ncbi:MAG: transporter [Flavobacterium sp.]|nr:MAG: transporter [Flavobacterium sp.]
MKNLPKIVFAAFFFFSAGVSAQEEEVIIAPIETDRPDQTESPSIVPKGMFQMETGFEYEQARADEKAIVSPTTLLKYGINENFELRLITEYSTYEIADEKISGLNPIKIGVKIKMLDEKGIIPKTSFIGHLLIPDLASSDFKADYYAAEFRFTMQHSLSDKLKLGYNLGAEWDGFTPEPTFIYALTGGYSFTDKFGGYVELYGFAPQNEKADHRFDGGFTYLVSNNFMIDASGGFGITENAPDYFISAGFSFRI